MCFASTLLIYRERLPFLFPLFSFVYVPFVGMAHTTQAGSRMTDVLEQLKVKLSEPFVVYEALPPPAFR